ncbi:MAG: glycosyl transferase group 1 [Myxococcales bacterium]|nr:glycosyl transferase group 1 [Myxococcales bacterium]
MLTILSVAFPFAPVGPDPVGGAEQVLFTLDTQIVAAGHSSIVLATRGSRTAGHLMSPPAHAGIIDGAAKAARRAAYQRTLEQLLRDHSIDVIHFHGVDFVDYLPLTDVPMVVSLHLPPSWYPPAAFAPGEVTRICVSHTQRAACPPGAAISHVITNGVDLGRYRPTTNKADHVIAIGRLCPEKGFDIALRAAKQANVPMVLAGATFPYETHQRHVREEIMPLLDDQRRWIGAIAGKQKRMLLAEARCLLVTSRIDETSSIVAMEALASGTPVVGFRRGALPEIVEHGVTGLLVDREDELPGAIIAASTLSAIDCRESVRERASATRMSARYLALYHECSGAMPRRGSEHAKGTDRSRLEMERVGEGRRAGPAMQRVSDRRAGPAMERVGERRRAGPAATDAVLITRDEELAALAGEWDALCDRCCSATPFQRPGWLLAWRRIFGHGGDLRAVAIRRGGRLVGFIPLEVRDRTLCLIGAGVTDYLDAIVEPDLEVSALDAAFRVVSAGCREVVLDGLRPGSPLLELELGTVRQTVTAPPSPVLALPAARIPARLAYDQRRLARMGNVRWEYEDTSATALLDGLFALHRARWAAKGERGVLDDPALERFHREAAAALHARRLLRLVGLRIEGRLAAVLYGFFDHGRFLFYLSGFEPELSSISPGRLVIAHAIERAVDEGAFEFDFLRGRETYKYEWDAVDRPAVIYQARLEEGPCSESAGL